MANEVETNEQGQPETEPIEVSPPPEAVQQAAAGKNIVIPTSAMAKIKEQERAKGARQAAEQAAQEYQQKLDAHARQLGYGTWKEFESMASVARQAPTAKQNNKNRGNNGRKAANKNVPHPRIMSRLEQMNARLLEEKKRLNRARAVEERRRLMLERELAAKDAETELRIAASRHGIRDVDYALHVLRNEISGADPETLEAFDEDKYFGEELRTKHPYLYGTETVPATTSPDQRGAPVAVSPATEAAKHAVEAASDKVDARKLSHQEYHELLRKRGLTDPSVGMPG